MNLNENCIQKIASYCYPREQGIVLLNTRNWKNQHPSKDDPNKYSLQKLFLLRQMKRQVKKNIEEGCRSSLEIDGEEYRCSGTPNADSLFCGCCGTLLSQMN